MKTILGVDPGNRVVGWAVLQQQGTSVARIASGIFRPPASKLRGKVLGSVCEYVHRLCREHEPDLAGVEAGFTGKVRDAQGNERDATQSALLLAEVRGSIIAALGVYGLDDVPAYQPSTVKKVSTGDGRAKKPRVAAMLAARFGVETLREDEADAIGVALARLDAHRARQQLALLGRTG